MEHSLKRLKKQFKTNYSILKACLTCQGLRNYMHSTFIFWNSDFLRVVLHAIIWFQVFLSNTNNYMALNNYFYLISHLFEHIISSHKKLIFSKQLQLLVTILNTNNLQLYRFKYTYQIWIIFSLVWWVLWHINLCRLFNAKSIFI